MLIIGLSLFIKSYCTIFSLVQILYSWLLGNNERLIISTCFPCFSQVKMDIFFNINGASKAIYVDTRSEVVIKTWKTSANNRSFSIS